MLPNRAEWILFAASGHLFENAIYGFVGLELSLRHNYLYVWADSSEQ